MLKKSESKQMKMSFVTLESLMPQEHFLRDLDRLVDFDFIYDKVADLYSNTGRPSIDPVVMIKMLLIGYIYGIDSERRLEQEITVNIAYRWFLGIDLDERVPDHSTISQLRRRKFDGTTVFRDIFEEVVRKCIETGLVSGKLLLTDSTHIRANARNDLREIVEVPDTPSEYMKKLNLKAYESGLLKEYPKYDETKTKRVIKSVTDPDSGFMNRPGKPIGFHYLNHQTCDSDNGIITDVHVTPGSTTDTSQHLSRIEYQLNTYHFDTEAICADSGYDCSEIYAAMSERGIKTYIPLGPTLTEHKSVGGKYFNNEDFNYDKDLNVYICPNNKFLKYTSYRKGRGYYFYSTRSSDCKNCPLKQKCIGTVRTTKRIERHVYTDLLLHQKSIINSPEYYYSMRLRKIWCEGNFSHQKENHNLRRTRKRGIERVTEQCLLSACALNLKRMVKLLKRRLLQTLYSMFFSLEQLRAEFFEDFSGFVNRTLLNSHRDLTNKRKVLFPRFQRKAFMIKT